MHGAHVLRVQHYTQHSVAQQQFKKGHVNKCCCVINSWYKAINMVAMRA